MTSEPDRPSWPVDLRVDASGRCCPVPMTEAAKALRRVAPGGVVEIVATDPASRFDIPVGVHRLGHELLAVEEQGGVFRYFVRRAG